MAGFPGEPLLIQGVQLAKDGQYLEALKIFEKLIDEEPGNDAAWVAKGKVLTNLGRYMDAFRAFDSALKINPQNKNAKANIEIAMQHVNDEIPMPESTQYTPNIDEELPKIDAPFMNDSDFSMKTVVAKSMPEIAILRRIPVNSWIRMLFCGCLGGFALGFILFPFFALTILNWGFIYSLYNLIGGLIIGIPIAYISGYFWKRTEMKDELEIPYATIILLVCLGQLAITVSFYMNFW